MGASDAQALERDAEREELDVDPIPKSGGELGEEIGEEDVVADLDRGDDLAVGDKLLQEVEGAHLLAQQQRHGETKDGNVATANNGGA